MKTSGTTGIVHSRIAALELPPRDSSWGHSVQEEARLRSQLASHPTPEAHFKLAQCLFLSEKHLTPMPDAEKKAYNEEMVTLLDRAIKGGHVEALTLCGEHYQHDYKHDANMLKKGIQLYKQAIAKGNNRAKLQLAIAYDHDLGVPPHASNKLTAIQLYTEAITGGVQGAEFFLGECLLNDKPPVHPGDAAKAFALFQQSANKGETHGIYLQGKCFLKDKGVPPNPRNHATGFALVQYAADKGNRDALKGLMDCYENGEGVAKHIGKYCAYEKAYQPSITVSEASKEMAKHLDTLRSKPPNEQLQSIKTLVEEGGFPVNLPINAAGDTPLHYAAAQRDKGMVDYLISRHADPRIRNASGALPQAESSPTITAALSAQTTRLNEVDRTVEQALLPANHKSSITLLEEAAKEGHTGAMVELSSRYRLGTGVVRNLGKALAYGEQALCAGNPDAIPVLGKTRFAIYNRTEELKTQPAETQLTAIRALVEKESIPVSTPVTPRGDTLLHIAMEQKNGAAVHYLLAKEPSRHLPSPSHSTMNQLPGLPPRGGGRGL